MKLKLFHLTTTVLLITLVAFLLMSNTISKERMDPDQQQVLPSVELPPLPKAKMPALNINGNQDGSEVYLQNLDIQVEVSGNIATTKYTMVFKNRTGKVLEGELLFPLPEGVSASHYALDINGKMREAVPVEKAKATQVFEEIEQRRVDPGLLERVEGNNFRTRIYPIPAHGSRTISIGYEEELPVFKQAFYYRLPMDYKEAIEEFSLKATVWKSSRQPQMDNAGNNEITFDREGENFVANFSRKNYESTRSLIFSLPAPTDIPQVMMQSASGSYYFTASCMPKISSRKKQWSNEIAIVWDASLSGSQRDIAKELEVIDRIIQQKKELSVSLYLLNNTLNKERSYRIRDGKWAELRQALESVVYDGGSNFKAVRLQAIDGEEVLFFSDGLSTLSDADFVATSGKKKPVHTIVSSPKADYSSLKWLAAQTNGKFINLNALSDPALKNELENETLHFIGIEHNSAVKEVYPSVSTPVQEHFSIAGILDSQQTNLTLLFGYSNQVEKKVSVKLNAKEAGQQGNVYRIWAQKKINELDMQYEKNKDELTELGQQFGIVTRNTSLIVLETVQDYITYNIVPPAELQAEYFRWKKGEDDTRQRAHQDFLNAAVATAKDLQQWWKTDFKATKSKYPQPDKMDIAVDEIPEPPLLREDIVVMEDVMMVQEEVSSDYADLQEVVISGYAAERRLHTGSSTTIRSEMADLDEIVEMEVEASKESTMMTTQSRQQAAIRLTPLKQDKEYTKSLTGNANKDYALYLELRPEYINTPSFYFDMADWFFRLNDKERALRILTSIADIDLENASLYRLLGYRLKEYKEYELQAYICQKLIQWRPMEPQSYRDYALALSNMGEYQPALDKLYSVVTQTYAQNINSRSRGIEEVVVSEINRLIALKELNTGSIDKRLIQAMPVDIRVVINWNMNNTDIDLHVKDPNGETCFYGHRSTAMGGRISNDITQGYGPEQFMLKKARKGKYEVFVNYYGDSQVKAEGPSTIMAEIYTNYAQKNEQRQVVCLQLSKENKATENGLLKVAEFEF